MNLKLLLSFMNFLIEEFALIFSLSKISLNMITQARFSGSLAPEVSLAGGFAEQGFAVYPNGTVGPDGAVRFELPAEQTTREDGTFLSGMNLSSASVSLAEIESDGTADARFRNAFSVLRFKLSSDVTRLTLTGTSPLAGTAPLKLLAGGDDSDGRLVIDEEGEWNDAERSLSVSILPSGGASCFTERPCHPQRRECYRSLR